MSNQMEALLMLAAHPLLKNVLLPVINLEREEFRIREINYGALSGGQQTALSWAWCIWKDMQVPADNGGDPEFKFNVASGVRDPIGNFDVMDPPLQRLVIQALMARHGFLRHEMEICK